MHERCTQLMSDWDTNSWCQYRTLQTAQHTIYSKYLHPEKAPSLSLSSGVNTHWSHRSWCWLLTTICGWTRVKMKKKRQNNIIKYSELLAPDSGPVLTVPSHKHRSHPSFIRPACRSVAVSAHSPDVATTGPSAPFSTNYLGRVWRKHRI